MIRPRKITAVPPPYWPKDGTGWSYKNEDGVDRIGHPKRQPELFDVKLQKWRTA